MKIEIGESLVYSWLRHEKKCQLAQNNWKASAFWPMGNRDNIQALYAFFIDHYKKKYGYEIAKSQSVDQFLKQAEIDALGISFAESKSKVYAVDVAFHEGGLNYGSKKDTVVKLVQKYIRSALCILAYFEADESEISFVSPKINKAVEDELVPVLQELQELFEQVSINASIRLYYNESFYESILHPLIAKENEIADTAELFLRSIQLYHMFDANAVVSPNRTPPKIKKTNKTINGTQNDMTGKAIKKIPKWANAPSQNNHKIIRAYFQLLKEKGQVIRHELVSRCQDEKNHPDVFVADFTGNFNSMKIDSEKSHGRVFCDDGYHVTIWEYVKSALDEYRSYFE